MRWRIRTSLVLAVLVATHGCSSEEVDAPPATPDRLVFRVRPAQVIAGTPFDPAVQVGVLLSDGSLDVSSSATVSLVSQSEGVADTLRGVTTVTAVAGVATFPALSLTRVSANTRLIARSSDLTGAESEPIRVVAGEATQLAFLTQPENVVAGQPLSALRVQLRDASGNRVASANGPITVAISTGPPGASIAGTATADLVAGEASFTDIRLPRAGAGYTLTASLVGTSGVRASVTRVFTTAAAAPAALLFVTEPTAATVGFPITPAVRVAVVDDFGNVVTPASTLVSIDLAVAPAGSQLTGSTTATSIAGVATFGNLRVDRAGTSVRLRATAPGLPAAVSAIFAVGAP